MAIPASVVGLLTRWALPFGLVYCNATIIAEEFMNKARKALYEGKEVGIEG